jgi:pimeloyl-ACP methyl ester carboxylesterase
MPVLFLAGGCDQLFPPDVIGLARARLPGAALVVVPGAGHSAYFECPDEFNRVLAAFLAGEVLGDG